MEQSAKPHDKFFRLVFSTPEAQQDLITLALPPKITNTFRMETVRDVGETIEEAKSPSAKPFAPESGAVDLLLSVQTTFGTEELVYILVEHKSYRDTRVAIALLRYVAGLYHKWEKLPLPVIRPVVFYHGSKPWKVPTDLTGLHGARGQTKSRSGKPAYPPDGHFPVNLRYHLFNLEEIPVEEIETRARARAYAGLMAFKFVHLTDIQMRRLLKATIVADIPDEFREMLWRYILGHIPTEDTDRGRRNQLHWKGG